MTSIARTSGGWWILIGFGSLLASGLAWARTASVLTSQLGNLVRDVHADGTRILAWVKRLGSESSREGGSGFTEKLAAVEQSSTRLRRAAHENEKRTQEALLRSAAQQTQAGETQRQVAGMQLSLEKLNHVHGNISGLMKTVHEIAFQSRILALNARIEAARAGEVGVSFGVVADQFGTLAERCAEAANSTTEFLSESTQSARDGMDKLNSLSSAVEEMGHSAVQMSASVREVRQAAGEQALGLDAMAEVIGVIKQQTNGRPATTHDAAVNQELYTLAGMLRKHAAQLSAAVGARNAKPAPGPQLVRPSKKKSATPPRGPRFAGAKAPAGNQSARPAC